jgi:adenine phosphoribosyltransferase
VNVEKALDLIRTIPDYPKPGVIFKDITPLLANGNALHAITDALSAFATPSACIAGIEARGFIFASTVAANLHRGFIPIRKSGKLPFTTHKKSYALEYGEASIEIHIDAIAPGQEVLLIDDVLATGGTMCAAIDLIAQCGGVVTGIATVIEIPILEGRNRISSLYPSIPIHALMIS